MTPSANGELQRDRCLHEVHPAFFQELCVFEIDGKHILVTGGSSGFGRHFARFLADRDASVTLAARRAEALAAGVATELNDDFFETENGKALIKRVPQRRLGQLNELDGPLLLLLSEAGSFMTGSVVAVDGGHLVSGL
jgi:NAD(P)-dependent dehydrogenase (short-subunit alcohol dehydrogenase family)